MNDKESLQFSLNSPQFKIRLPVEKKYMQTFLAYKDNTLNPTANINSLSVISRYITGNQQDNQAESKMETDSEHDNSKSPDTEPMTSPGKGRERQSSYDSNEYVEARSMDNSSKTDSDPEE